MLCVRARPAFTGHDPQPQTRRYPRGNSTYIDRPVPHHLSQSRPHLFLRLVSCRLALGHDRAGASWAVARLIMRVSMRLCGVIPCCIARGLFMGSKLVVCDYCVLQKRQTAPSGSLL